MPEQLPARITLEGLALSPAEQRAFPRWYTDLLLRKRADCVAIGDVLTFVDNFGISTSDKSMISSMFGAQLVTLEPPQFYVFLRLTGHLLQGKQLRAELAFVAAPVPKPRPILHKNAAKSRPSSSAGKDMDSFMSLMSGHDGGVKKRKKRVTFDSRPPQVTEAAHRSMGELLRQQQIQEQLNLPQLVPMNPEPNRPEPTQPSQQQEPDQPIANNQFAHVNIESVLHNGQSSLPEPPAPRKAKAGDSYIQQLTRSTQNTQSQQAQPVQQVQQQHAQQVQQARQQAQQMQQMHLQAPQIQSPQMQVPTPPRPRVSQTGIQPLLNGQLIGQLTGMQSQSTGMQPQLSGQVNHMSSMQPQLSGQVNMSGMEPQLSGQLNMSGMQPQLSGQVTGMRPQLSGQPQLTGQLSGQMNSMRPQHSGPPQMGMHPHLSGSHMTSQMGWQRGRAMSTGVPNGMAMNSSQSSGMHQMLQTVPQTTLTVPNLQNGMAMQPLQQQPSGIQPLQQHPTGMQFINSVQTPQAYQISGPPQYVRNDGTFNMQQMRDQMSNS